MTPLFNLATLNRVVVCLFRLRVFKVKLQKILKFSKFFKINPAGIWRFLKRQILFELLKTRLCFGF
jgi:hypothetical protein